MSSTPSLRAICGARVSVTKGPQKVSHLAQQETAALWVAREGHTVIGTFTDLDVSATVPPEKRPDLGPWLTPEKSWEWDVLVFSKIDRAFRSTRHMVKLAEWCEQQKKILVFAEDGLVLNYRDPKPGLEHMMAELFVYIGSFFAQLELCRFESRAEDAHRQLRFTERWPGGPAPTGFRTVPHPDGRGKILETDPEGKAVLEMMAEKLVEEGWSFLRIADWCNENGYPSSRSKANGSKPNWGASTVKHVLTNLATQGLKTSAPGKTEGCIDCESTKHGCRRHRERVPILDASGKPVRLAPPTFSEARWEQIQAAVAERQRNTGKKTGSSNEVRDVGYCGKCGRTLTVQRRQGAAGDRNYVRCAGAGGRGCRGIKMYRLEQVQEMLEETFLEAYADDPFEEQVFIPGSDNSAELERVNAAIERLRRESDAGLITDEETYFTRLSGLTTRKRELEANPITPPRTEYVATGETFGQIWDRSDWEGRRAMLAKAGIKFVIHADSRFELVRPK